MVKATSFETEEVKIEDVFESTEVDKFTDSEGKEVEVAKPFRIRIVDAKGDILSDDSTRKTLAAKNWLKKFYKNKEGYWNFTRNENLLAIMEILKAKNHKIAKELEEKGEFNINDLKGVKFDAVVGGNDVSRWISWVQTFMANGVEVPERSETSEKTEGAKAKEGDNTEMVQKLFDVKDWEGKKLFVKDADGDYTVASDEQRTNNDVEKFYKGDNGEMVSTITGLPF